MKLPVWNCYIRLDRHYREDMLHAYWLNDLHQIRALTNQGMEDYNTNHPHSVLGDIPPREYKDRFGEEFLPETNNFNKKLLNLAMS